MRNEKRDSFKISTHNHTAPHKKFLRKRPRGGSSKKSPRLPETSFLSRGFTMIEAVITIAIVAILAAILVPMISSNIDSAKLSRAQADVGQIAKAVVQFRQDLDRWPIERNGNIAYLLYSGQSGDIPSGWPGFPAANMADLNHELVNNGENEERGTSTVGAATWKGPYLTEVRPDPWGNSYVINSQHLTSGAPQPPAVYVVSAGPGHEAVLQVPFGGGSIPTDSDDIYRRIR